VSALTTLQIGVTASPDAGGLERYYHGLLGALPLEDVSVIRVLGGDEGNLVRRWARIRAGVSGAIRASDVVVSHFAFHTFAALDRLRTKPFAIHFHGPWAGESKAEGAGRMQVVAKRELERLVYRCGARVIVLSQAFADIAEREYGVPAAVIRIIPGGVDCARFAPTQSRTGARAELGLPLNRPLVVAVQRLVRRKGLELLINAADELRRGQLDVLIAIAGRGPLASELADRIRERGLEEHVRLLGFVADNLLPTLYRAADLAVVPSTSLEGFGLVVVEALASGTPVLVTPVAGLPEVVADLSPALVLSDASAGAVARGIGEALSGALPLPEAEACVRYARRFDWETIARHVAGVYREIA
jgi:glycosyltransferase involved in cell wall biosynthesis